MDKAVQAEMGKLTSDGLLVHIALCNMKGDKLKDKFLIAEDLTVAKMRNIASVHEMAEVNKLEDNIVRQTKSQPSAPGNQDKSQKTCFACGDKGHTCYINNGILLIISFFNNTSSIT